MQSFVFGDYCRLDGRTGKPVEPVEITAADAIQLCAARNEFVSFQVAVKDILLKDIIVDATFDAGLEVTVYYEWFHSVGDKLIPDMLVPQANNLSNVTEKYYKSDYSVYWVDVFIPKNAKPGTYTGEVCVKAGDAQAFHKIEIEVFKAELADESLLIADMNNYADSVTRHYPHLKENPNRFADGSYFAAEKEFYRVSHEHRAIFHHLPYDHNGRNVATFAPKLSGEGKNIRVSDWTLYDEHFGPYYDGSAFKDTKREPIPIPYAYLPFNFNWPSSYEKWGTEGYKIENRRILLDFIRHFEEKGWTKTVFEIFYNHKKRYRYYPFDGDEVRHEQDTEIIYTFDDIFGDLLNQSNVQVIFRTDASWSYGSQFDTDISQIIKMWAVGSGILLLYPESFAHMKSQGNILWIYGGFPSMDNSLLSLCGFPLRCLQNDFGGCLYWNATGIGEDFLTAPTRGGSMAMFYPGHPFGLTEVLPSIRLKYLRNIMQVADIVKMHEGTWAFHKMRNAIDTLFGVSRHEWHDTTPENMRIPPQELTNELIASASRNNPMRFATPEISVKMKKKILELAADYKGASSPWL